MNWPELKLYLLCSMHIIVWIIVMFLGILSRRGALINVLILLPMVFIVQSVFPVHIFMKTKMVHVNQNLHHLKKKSDVVISRNTHLNLVHYAESVGMSLAQVIENYKVIKYYEDGLLLPRVTDWLKLVFDESFKNPMDAYGMVIIAYVINCYLLYLGRGDFCSAQRHDPKFQRSMTKRTRTLHGF